MQDSPRPAVTSSQLLSTQLASTTELNSVQNPIQPHPTARDWWHAGKRRQTKTQLAQAHILAQCVSAGCASVLVSFDHILFCSRGRWRMSSLLMETRKPPFCHPIHLVVYCYGLFIYLFFCHPFSFFKRDETKRRVPFRRPTEAEPSPAVLTISGY